MTTKILVNAVAPLANGDLLVRATKLEGDLLQNGQRGESSSGGRLVVEVIGTGVIDPNLVMDNRVGLLVKMIHGDPAGLAGETLQFPSEPDPRGNETPYFP